MDLEQVAELVSPPWSAHAGTPEVLGEQPGDNLPLVRGKVIHLRRGEHVKTGEAAAAHEPHLHECPLTRAAPGSGRREKSAMSVSGPGP